MHTLGPWKTQIETNSNGVVKTFVVGQRYIAEVFNWAKPSSSYIPENITLNQEAEANARLIAKAPLLDECRELLKTFGDIGSTQELPRRIRDLAHAARQLLAKLEE